jgi:hypothetical protein
VYFNPKISNHHIILDGKTREIIAINGKNKKIKTFFPCEAKRSPNVVGNSTSPRGGILIKNFTNLIRLVIMKN